MIVTEARKHSAQETSATTDAIRVAEPSPGHLISISQWSVSATALRVNLLDCGFWGNDKV